MDPAVKRPPAAVLEAIPREIVALADYEAWARDRLDDNAWIYLMSGAADGRTSRENYRAFERLCLKGRVLNKVSSGHTRLELFGRSYAHPILLAPIAYQRLFHPEGELAAVLGAAAMDAGMVVSTLATTSLEDIARAAAASGAPPLWFQLYLQAQREDTLTLVRRAEASGYGALVVTIDAPLAGIRNAEQRAGFRLPPGMAAANLAPLARTRKTAPGVASVFDGLMADAPGWEDIKWLAGATTLPVLLKGILDADDARRALDCGAAGIIVSNHGGRIQDALPSTIEALPAVAAAVRGRAPVLLDGGVRRGSDIVKALALGASAVLLGRPYIHALATAGALGVAHALRTLREELEIVMALNGHATLAAIGPDALFNSALPMLSDEPQGRAQ